MKKDNNKDKNKNKNKVYKNETKNKEAELVNMYSCKDSDKEVDIRLKILRICYGGISAFLDQNHIKIVDELYFNSNHNILDDSNVKMADIVALSESTMKRYRDKYCKVADLVFSMLNDIDL